MEPCEIGKQIVNEKERRKTIVGMLQDNTQKIFEISGRVTRILSLLTGNNEVRESGKDPNCMTAEVELQDMELQDIARTLEKIEKILN